MSEKLRLASAGNDIKLWELPGLSMVSSLCPHSQPVTSLCWSSNNQNLASVGGDKVVVTYMKGTMNSSTDYAVGDGHTCAAFNSTSRYLLVGGKSKTLSVWDLKSKSVKKTYKEHKDAVSCLMFNWNDTSIASGSVDGSILLHNVVTGHASQPLRQPKTQAIRGIQYSHFRKSLLASVSDDGALNMWDTNARKLLISFANEHKAPATALSFSPVNEMLLASVALDKKIVFYDVQGKKSVKTMTADAPLTAVDFLQDGVTLAVGTTRGKICVYDLRSGSSPVTVQVAHMSSVQCLKFQNAMAPNKGTSLPPNKTTKSVISVNPLKIKPLPHSLPKEPQRTAPQDSAPTQPSESSSAGIVMLQQNGIKEEEEELFSPLREVKPSLVSARPTGPYDGELSVNSKVNKPADNSGIFSPLASNTSTSDVRHHPVGGPAYSSFDIGPRTTAEPTPSGARLLTDPHPNTRYPADDHTQPRYPTKTPNQDVINYLPSRTSDNSDTNIRFQADPTDPRARLPLESSASSARLPTDSSPSVSRHGSDLSDRNTRPEAEQVHGDIRPQADREAMSDTTVGGDSYQGDVDHSWAPDGARGGQSGGLPPSPGGSSYQPREFTRSGAAECREDGPDILRNGAEYTNGHVTAQPTTAGLQPFQVEFIKNMIEDSMDEFRVAIHRDVVNLQVEMLRQFQIQQNELRGMMERYSVNEALVAEIDRLREENRRLKTKY